MRLTMRHPWKTLSRILGGSDARVCLFAAPHPVSDSAMGQGPSRDAPESITPWFKPSHAASQNAGGGPRAGKASLPDASRRGFSLIEVLVAMTILSIIVLIVAGIFQQTGLAWSLGLKRADAQSVTRAVVGALGRDLAMMVDPYNFMPMDGTAPLAADRGITSPGKLSGSLDFWILRPPTDPKETLKGDPGGALRELIHVTYSGGSSVTRKEEPYEGGRSSSTTYALKGGGVTFERVSAGGYDDAFNSGYDQPAVQIKIKPQTPPTVNDYEIAVASCGPDGKWGTEDDLRPWPEGEDK